MVARKQGKKTLRIISKTFKLVWNKGACQARVKLALAKRYKGKRLSMTLTLTGSTQVAAGRRVLAVRL